MTFNRTPRIFRARPSTLIKEFGASKGFCLIRAPPRVYSGKQCARSIYSMGRCSVVGGSWTCIAMVQWIIQDKSKVHASAVVLRHHAKMHSRSAWCAAVRDLWVECTGLGDCGEMGAQIVDWWFRLSGVKCVNTSSGDRDLVPHAFRRLAY